jgi:hypothetical protein
MVAEKFVDGVVKLHGMPSSIMSDRDKVFISKFWQEFFKMSGTQLKMSSAYHPQTDGQSEVVNHCVEQYLRCFVHQRPRQLSQFLPWAELWYNTAYHSSTGTTPFQALYGRLPPTFPLYATGSSPVNEVDHSLQVRDTLLRNLKQNLANARNRMKQLVDRGRRDVEFIEGDLVYLKLQPYRQQTAFRRAHQKLACKFYGPFPIEKRVGDVAYKLKLPEGARLHSVFHVSLLKRKLGDKADTSMELPPIDEEGTIVVTPEAILDTRWIPHGARFIEESLVKWKHLSTNDATWEPTAELLTNHPSLDLGDKHPLDVGGNDTQLGELLPRRTPRVIKKNLKYRD